MYLGSGLVIPKVDWEQPYNGKKMWLVYPDFVDYASSYYIKNINWYDDGPYNPN